MARKENWGANRPKPVQKVELDEKHKKLRLVLLACCIVIAIIAFTVGLTTLLNQDPGWQRIETLSNQINCGADFTLMYYMGGGSRPVPEENRELSNLYTEATERAYRLFYAEAQSDTRDNLRAVNENPNEIVTVDPALYQAFCRIVDSGNRNLYLAPVYVEYDRIFLYENEDEALRYDPTQDPEQLAYLAELVSFANNPEAVNLELLGNNQVRLNVSAEYLAYARENELEDYLDFGWMKNAFIVDMIADILRENGYTRGYIASYDGFNRSLDNSGTQYSFNIYDRYENGIYLPAAMEYNTPMSIVSLRNYPMGQQDRWHYFAFSDGRIVTAMVDPADGLSKSATDNLVAYSYSAGCAEVLLAASKVYLADELDTQALAQLADGGIYALWCADTTLYYNDAGLTLALMQTENITYQAKLVK